MKELNIKFTDRQQKQINDYLNIHLCNEFKKNSGGFGATSKLGYRLTSNSIGGWSIWIQCPYCQYETDITDIDTW